MEDEYPDPDEEFELMHADEFELMNDFENDYPPVSAPITRAKRSLDFTKNIQSDSESTSKKDSVTSSKDDSKDDQSNVPESPLLQMPETPVAGENSKARTPFSEKKEANAKADDLETNQRTPVSRNKKPGGNSLDKEKVEDKIESNKRSFDELFGDIADIELEELLSGAKRSKTDLVLSEDERQEMMIAKILAERKRHQAMKLRSLSSDPNDLTARCKDSVSMTRKVPKWPFFPITDKKGSRLYARLNSDDHVKRKADSFAAATNSSINLSRSFVTTLDAAKQFLEKKLEQPEPKAAVSSVREAKKKSVKEHTTDLWVEKYKPRSYLELLSDEGTNRIVLQWLKLWDKVVFNKENKFIRKSQPNEKETFFKKNVPILDEELDENNCPKAKIALLCGPPGLGKTTLAHLLARHAGYNSVEVNASDDRSLELFQRKLETATQMQSVMGKSPRPNCLILDEIDGAPAPSINFLIKFASGKSSGKGKGKKTEQQQTLKRPIICICNNIYAPALRPLRQAALVIHFPETSSARLAQRLVEIARKERITTDLSAMMALSQKTNNDIRSCLSTLYCYQDQPVKLALIKRLNIGQKDMQKGFFSVWQDVFQIMKPQSGSYLSIEKSVNTGGASTGKTNDTSFKNRMWHVVNSVQGCGDYDKLVQGVFENYLNMNLKDSFFLNISEGLDWFCFYDIISQVIYSQQAFVLMGYIPYCFPVWHFLFSSYNYPKLTYPNVNQEVSVKASKTEQAVEDLLKGTPAYIRAYTCKKPLQLDILPLLNVIINPNLRPVNTHLYSKREKEEFNKVVNTMIDYNLNFIQERALDGNFVWRIDPDINEVVKFDSGQQDVVVSSASASLKQLLSREIEMEKVRRLEIVSSAQQSVRTPSRQKGLYAQKSQHTPSGQKIDSSKTPNTPKSGSDVLPNHLQKLTPKAISKTFVNVPTKDFFGRVVKETEEETKKKKERKEDDIVKSEIWFHHKEGYNNAVRRPVTMKELM